jgi:hypothetical protein
MGPGRSCESFLARRAEQLLGLVWPALGEHLFGQALAFSPTTCS